MTKYSLFFVLILNSFTAFLQQRDTSRYKLLWEISSDSVPFKSYLFGSFHQNDNRVFNFPDSLLINLYNSDAVILETDLSRMMGKVRGSGDYFSNIMNRYMQDMSKKNKKTQAYLEKGIETAYGYSSGQPQFIDMYFKSVADNCHKDFFPLERLIDQERISTEMALAKPDTVIEKTKKMTKKEWKSKQKSENMYSIYLAGDIDSLNKLMRASYDNQSKAYDILITNRNLIMLAGIDTLVKQHACFIAVGAGHLGGDEGLVHLLKEKGFHVRRVTPTYNEAISDDYKEKMNACSGVRYEDSLFHFSATFNGLAAAEYKVKSGVNKVAYQEFGQGNIYTIESYHPDLPIDASFVFRKLFLNWNQGSTCLDTYHEFTLDDGTPAAEADVVIDAEQYKIRAVYKDGTVHLIEASGSDDFLASEKAEVFLNSFQFDTLSDNAETKMVDISDTMHIVNAKMPNGYIVYENSTSNEYEKTLFAKLSDHESISINEFTLGQGSYISSDSIFIHNNILAKIDTNKMHVVKDETHDDYIQIDYVYSDTVTPTRGRTYLLGNSYVSINYLGQDTNLYNSYLADFSLKATFTSSESKNITKGNYSTQVPLGGFKRIILDEEQDFSYTRGYYINDYKDLTSYNIVHRQFKDWAFELDKTDSLLQKLVNVVVDDGDSIQIEWIQKDTIYEGIFSHEIKASRTAIQGKIFAYNNEIIIPFIVEPKYIANHTELKSNYLDSFQVVDRTKINFKELDELNLIKLIKDEDLLYAVAEYIKILPANPEKIIELLCKMTQYTITQDAKNFESLLTLLASSVKGNDYNQAYFNWWKKNQFSDEFNATFLANSFGENKFYNWSDSIVRVLTPNLSDIDNWKEIFAHAKQNSNWFANNVYSISEVAQRDKQINSLGRRYFFYTLDKHENDSLIHAYLYSKAFKKLGKHLRKTDDYFAYLKLANALNPNEGIIEKWHPKDNFHKGERFGLLVQNKNVKTPDKPKLLDDTQFQDGYIYMLDVYDSLELLTNSYEKEKVLLLYASWLYAPEYYNMRYLKTITVEGHQFLIGEVMPAKKQVSDTKYIAQEVNDLDNIDFQVINDHFRLINLCDIKTADEDQIKNYLRLGLSKLK